MTEAEKFIREQIPTMVLENHVAAMKLNTLIALLQGYHKSQVKNISLNPDAKRSFSYEIISANEADLYDSEGWAFKRLAELGNQGYKIAATHKFHESDTVLLMEKENISQLLKEGSYLNV